MLTQPLDISNEKIPQVLPPVNSLFNRIQYLLTKNTTQCSFSNKALYICTNKNCLHPSPFLCTLEQCKCQQNHQLCQQITLKSFLKIFDKKQKIKNQIQEKINDRTDKLIDQISDLRQRMIQNIRQGNYEQMFGSIQDKKLNENFKNIKQLKENDLTGKLISSIYESDQKLQSQNKIQKILEKVDKIFDNVNSYVNNEFFKIGMTAGKIHSKSLKLFWSPQLKGASQQIKGKRVKKVSSVLDRYALLQPSINKLGGLTIKWSVKIISINNWVGLGICFKKIVEKNKFDFVNYTSADHGGLIISSNGFTWSHGNSSQNSSQTLGIAFSANDVIEFELNLNQSLLKYKNKNTNKSNKLNNINKINTSDENQVYICSCMGGVGDEIEMGNVMVDGVEAEWAEEIKM